MKYIITSKQYEQLISIKLRRLSVIPQMIDYAIDKVKQKAKRSNTPDVEHMYIHLIREVIRDILNKKFYNYSYTLSPKDMEPRRDDAYIIAHNIVHQNYRYIKKKYHLTESKLEIGERYLQKSINEQELEPSDKKKIIKKLNIIDYKTVLKFFDGEEKLKGFLGDGFYKWASNNRKFIFDRIWEKGLMDTAEFFGGRDKLIEVVGFKNLVGFLVYFYKDSMFYGDNFYFVCNEKNFDEYLDGVILDADNQHEISMDEFFEGIDDNFKSILISTYGDELKSFWDQKRAELCTIPENYE